MAKFKQEDRHWILQFDNGSETYLGHNNIPSKFDGAKVIPEDEDIEDKSIIIANYREKVGDVEINISIEAPEGIAKTLIEGLIDELNNIK